MAHLVLAALGGQEVALEMTGPAAIGLAHVLTELARDLWAAEQYLARTNTPDTASVGADRQAS